MRLPKILTAVSVPALIALVAVAAPAPATAATTSCDRVASPTGSDTAAGTLASPYRSATKLAGSLAPGQTGCFRVGTYGFSTLSLHQHDITLAPYGAEAVTLSGHIKVYPDAENSVIEGMTLDASPAATTSGPKIYASGVVLRDNEITNDNTAESCVIIGAYYNDPAPSGVVIERNRIHHCGRLPRTNLDHGIYISAARDTVVRDNWIYANADLGVQQYPNAHNSLITGNVIANNHHGFNFSGSGSLVTTGARVEGNIVVGSLGYNAYSGGSGPDGTDNLFRNNCVHTASGGSGIEPNARSFTASNNLIASPGFVDAAAADFRLKSDSACLAKYTGTMSGVAPDSSADLGTVTLKVNRPSVRRGGWITLRGRIPALASGSQQVAIQRWHPGGWRPTAGNQISTDVRFSKRVRVRAGRVLRFQATVPGAEHSRVVRVRVPVRS